jgi:hypothetical protein
MSEDKVRKTDMCWSVRRILGSYRELLGISGPGLKEAGRYKWYHN